MIDHHVADHAAHVPARKRVVADVRNAVRREVVPADREDVLPHRRRHPRIDAVADDVVERAPRRVDVGDVELAQLDVGEAAALVTCPLALLDLARRQIDADEARIRQLHRHRDQVVAAGAAQFQHAAGVDVGRLQAEEPGERREAIRMRLRKRLVDVGHFVVAGGSGRGSDTNSDRTSRLHGEDGGAQFGTELAPSFRNCARVFGPYVAKAGSSAPEYAARARPTGSAGMCLRSAASSSEYTFTRVRAEHLALHRRRELGVAVLLAEFRRRSGTRETPRSGPAASRTRCCRCPTARCPRRRP